LATPARLEFFKKLSRIAQQGHATGQNKTRSVWAGRCATDHQRSMADPRHVDSHSGGRV